MRWIVSVFLLVMTGCMSLTPERGEKDETKKRIETQQVEMDKKLKLDNSYKIDGRYIYFYSPQKKLVKNIDVLTRNEFYFDEDERLIEKRYHPKREVKSLGRGMAFQENENYYNTLALLTRSEVWMYGIYNNSVTYTYDKLLRLTEEVYRDAKDKVYTIKKYSYKDSFYIDKVSTYDGNNKLVEVEEYSYNRGRITKVVYRDGNGKVKRQEKYTYQGDRVAEKAYGSTVEKYIYEGDLLVKMEEYENQVLKAYDELTYDKSGRVVKRDTFTSEGVLTMRNEYRY